MLNYATIVVNMHKGMGVGWREIKIYNLNLDFGFNSLFVIHKFLAH
jgi:hypothetical protein